jgi:hypothetical protein
MGSGPAKSKRPAGLARFTAIAGGALLATAVLASTAGAAVICSNARRSGAPPCVQYKPQTMGDKRDPTFNQLLGINTKGQIAGYFGNGDVGAGHPNQGYLLSPPYNQGNFQDNNFPGSVQTQDIGVNDHGVLVGFWADQAGNQFGWYKRNGQFKTGQLSPVHPPKPGDGQPAWG